MGGRGSGHKSERARRARLQNIQKARAARKRTPLPWRSGLESRIIEQLVWQWWNDPGPRKWPAYRVARFLDVSHTWIAKLVKRFQADPDRMRRRMRAFAPANFEKLQRARQETIWQREHGRLRGPIRWRRVKYSLDGTSSALLLSRPNRSSAVAIRFPRALSARHARGSARQISAKQPALTSAQLLRAGARSPALGPRNCFRRVTRRKIKAASAAESPLPGMAECIPTMEAAIFVGVHGAGKSTFYRERFFNTHVRINLDMFRTRHREKLLLEACLEARQSFVVDNTNPTVADRARYVVPARERGFYFFDVELSGAMKRNQQRLGLQRIPVAGVTGTFRKLQAPTLDEGFHQIFTVSVIDGNGFNVTIRL